MSDREVEVSVQAEGVDDAAGELSGETLAEGPEVSGAGGRRGGLKGALAGGLLGGLLSQLKSVTNILEPILAVLNAFLAPLGLIALRLLQPVLRELLQLLPAWFAFLRSDTQEQRRDLLARIATAMPFLLLIYNVGVRIVNWVSQLPSKIQGVADVIPTWSEIQSGLQSLRSRLVSEITSLPASIGAAVGRRLPNIGGLGGGGGSGDGGLFDGLLSRFSGDDGGGGDSGGGAVVNLEGGLDAFVNRITKDPTFDFP